MSGRSSTLLLVLMLLLSRIACGDIGSSSGSHIRISTTHNDEQPSNPSSAATYATRTSVADATATITSDELQRSLRFVPPTLDFGDACPIGTARAHTVTLVNQNANRSVYLTSVSGRTPTFYSSFFETKVVPPQGNTTFNVVFLPRTQGNVATDLLIHTSFGQARLEVRGEGRDCPYRLKPLVGIKAPLNATLTPEIQMYNPHNRPLQILEVYSSGGQFQLELPSGGQEGPQTLWEIPPYETKSVIRIRFHARSAGNYTAYIRIKISEQVTTDIKSDSVGGDNGNVLVIPVEFEILPLTGLYTEIPVINFGRLSTGVAKTIQIKLHLHSSYARQQHRLFDYTLRNLAGLTFDPKDGVLTLESALFEGTTTLDEIMVLRSISSTLHPDNDTQTLAECTVLIRGEIFKGALSYDANTTTFVTQATLGTRGGNKRALIVRNDFETPLALLNVSFPQHYAENGALRAQLSSDYLDAIVTGALTLERGASLPVLHLQMLNSSMVYKTILLVRTNITHIEVPLVVCGGRLHVSTYDTARIQPQAAYSLDLNLGAIPLAETSHNGYIVLRNRNPLAIKLNTWNFKSPQGVYFHTSFRGCLRPSSMRALRNATLKLENAKYKLCTQLEEEDVAVFQVTIQSYITEQHQCTLQIWTTYEEITATVRFRTWIGKLEVDQEHLYFDNCFPGKHCSAELTIRSTFQHPIHISSINFTEAGLHFEDYKTNGSTIEGNALTKVGRIHFEPSVLCQQRCYIPQDERNNLIAFPEPAHTRGGHNNNLHFDEIELRRRTELFRHLKYDFQNIAFTLNSNELRQFLLEFIIDIEWPKFVSGKQVLPTIEVGKMQEVQLLLSNPADTPVLLDYFLADPRYAKATQLSLPLEVVDISPHCYLTDKDVFSLPDGVPQRPILLPAHTSLPVKIRFEAPIVDNYCTLLHIRNNLTLYEAVWVSAKVVQSQFRIGNRKPGPNSTLPFDFNEKHFAICNQQQQQQPAQTQQKYDAPQDGNAAALAPPYPRVVLRRTFTARNTGEMPIWIKTFQIGDQFCSGYGFSVTNCSSFVLNVNETRKLDFTFTPDYTLSRIVLPLRVHTNLSYAVHYNLMAQLPPGTIERCAALIPRPEWEERIRHSAIVLLATTFIFVLIAAHIDYRNILVSQTALFEAREKGSVYPTFNLRNIALKAQAAAAQPPEEQEATEREQASARQSTQAQRRGGIHHARVGNNMSSSSSTTSSSSSSGSSGSVSGSNYNSGATGSGGTSAGGVRKRGLKRQQTNANGNVTATRASLPWSLDLNAFKSGASMTKTASESERNTCTGGANNAQQLSGAGESGGKKGANTPPSSNKAQTHNDKMDRSGGGGGGGGGAGVTATLATCADAVNATLAGANQSKKTQQATASPPQVCASPQPTQQPRSARKAKQTATATTAAAASGGDRDTVNGNASTLKSPTNSAGNVKSARANTSKTANGELLQHTQVGNVKAGGTARADAPYAAVNNAPATSTPSPPAKEANAATATAKHGKTPGRERRKDVQSVNATSNDAAPANLCASSSASRRAERRSRQRAAAALRALNFGADAAAASATGGAARAAKAANGSGKGGVGGVGGGSGGDFVKGATAMNGLLSCLNTAWDNGSQVSFSDVLQAQPVNLLLGKGGAQKSKEQQYNASSGNESLASFLFADKEKSTAAEREMSFGSGKPAELRKHQHDAQTFGEIAQEKTPSMVELGPIGSKKSPSSTPVWEPINSSSSSSGSSNHSASGLQMPKPVVPAGNSSFFSNLLTNYEYDASQALRGAIDSNLYDLKKAQDEYFEYMYNMRQQQLQAQAQAHAHAHAQAQQHQQQQQQQQLLQGVDWARLNSRTWSPMAAYLGQHDNALLSGNNGGSALAAATGSAALLSGLNGVGGQDVATAASAAWPIGGVGGVGNALTSSAGATSGAINGSGSSVIRPPPGLENNFQAINNNNTQQASVQQQQQQQQQQQLQLQQQQSLGGLATDATNANTFASSATTNTADMQTFDPFSSLSSIWSDSWQKRNNSNNNSNNKNNANMN